MNNLEKIQILSGNTLKLIALLTMTIDHIGMILFPDLIIFRIIGRIAYPIYAYLIAEGCYYTRSMKKYISMVFVIGILCQLVFFISARSLYMCIMITFTMSIGIIWLMKIAYDAVLSIKENTIKAVAWIVLFIAGIAVAYIICNVVGKWLPDTDWYVDYGFYGVLLPVIFYIPNFVIKEKNELLRFIQVFLGALWMILIARSLFSVQWWSFLAVIFLIMYNGTRGRDFINKYVFYLYYPVHLGLIYLIGMIPH